jgi:hypothetical protein
MRIVTVHTHFVRLAADCVRGSGRQVGFKDLSFNACPDYHDGSPNRTKRIIG